MENEELVAIDVCCVHYGIELGFVRSLSSSGLIELVTVNDTDYLYRGHISALEKLIRLHDELGVNLEGLEAIAHLLKRVSDLQEEVRMLRNRLSLYEDQTV